MPAEDFILDDGPDTVILRVDPDGESRNLSSKALIASSTNVSRAAPALYDKKAQEALGNALVQLIAEVSLETPVLVVNSDKKHQIKDTNPRPEIANDSDDIKQVITPAKVMEMFSEEERKLIFRSKMSYAVDHAFYNLPPIHVVKSQEEIFKRYLRDLGADGLKSWPDVSRYFCLIDVLDVFHEAPHKDKSLWPELTEYIGKTGGYLIRACRENANSKYAFCSWIINNELHELIPNVGWGPPPPQPTDPPYRVADVPIKGKALLATRTIEAGEIILQERPLVISASTIHQHGDLRERFYNQVINVLSPELKAAFLSLSDAGKPVSHGPRNFRICETNNIHIMFPLSKKLSSYGGVFALTSRCNHSCSPNTLHGFDPKTLVGELRATRMIKPGEEITFGYCGLTEVASERQADLKRRYQFDCTCEACSLPPNERKASDERRKRIATLSLSMSLMMMRSAMDHPITTDNQSVSNIDKILSKTKGKEKVQMFEIDEGNQEIIPIWSPEDIDTVRRNVERFIKTHTDVLSAVEAENLHYERFDFIRWICRAYAVLGDKEKTRYWLQEGRKAMRIALNNKVNFRDTEKDIVDTWEQVIEDVTRHPEWDYIQKRVQLYQKRKASMNENS